MSWTKHSTEDLSSASLDRMGQLDLYIECWRGLLQMSKIPLVQV
jgi:hypothetical protein